MKKGREKKEEKNIKKGARGLRNASFWSIILKKNSRGVFRPPRLGVREKNEKGERKKGEKALKMHLFGL